jgi:CheY-like chemotaxis protein
MKDVRAGVVVFTQDGSTDFLEGTVSVRDDTIRFDVDGRRFGVALDALQRIATDKLPASFPKRFDDGVMVQWKRSGRRRRAVIETDRQDLRQFIETVSQACLHGTSVHVEQQRTPTAFDTDADPRTATKATTMRIDSEREAIEFDAAHIVPIRTDRVTSVETLTLDFEGQERKVVAAKTLAPDTEVTSRILPRSNRLAGLLRDYLVNSYEHSELGGPIRVLLVDDEPGLTDVARLHLRQHHAELSVRAATTTSRAKQLVQQEDFECIVSDYEMPEGGAPEILAVARESSPSIPFVVFSRRAADDVPDADSLQGVDEWIEKEMGTDQYHRIALLIKHLVAQCRYGE